MVTFRNLNFIVRKTNGPVQKHTIFDQKESLFSYFIEKNFCTYYHQNIYLLLLEKIIFLVKIDQKSRHGCVKSEQVLWIDSRQNLHNAKVSGKLKSQRRFEKFFNILKDLKTGLL